MEHKEEFISSDSIQNEKKTVLKFTSLSDLAVLKDKLSKEDYVPFVPEDYA